MLLEQEPTIVDETSLLIVVNNDWTMIAGREQPWTMVVDNSRWRGAAQYCSEFLRIVDNKVVHFFGVKSLILHLKYLDVTFDCPNDKEDVPDDKNNAQMNMNIDTIVIHTPEKNITSNTGSIRGDPDWISKKNSLELIELSSINKVSLV